MLIHCRPDQWRIVAPTKIVLHLIRHSQGFHNLSVENHALHDPSLTDLGKQQCRDLQANFPYHAKITHLVASPLRRTIYTCLLTFADEVEQGLVVVALPEIQETSGLPCDTGSDASKLREEFGEAGKVDLSLVKDGWNNKKGRWAAEASAVEKRAKDARLWLRDMASKSDTEEVHIAVVTHGGFLHYLTEDWAGCEKFVGTGWANTEFRSYTFKWGGDENASLVETTESWERRKGREKPMTEAEQRNLKAVAQQKWHDDGFVSSLGKL